MNQFEPREVRAARQTELYDKLELEQYKKEEEKKVMNQTIDWLKTELKSEAGQ